jgi:DNA-binding CsgD family transcriptional regulator/N-acetylneuraminic acid mutarotase
MVVEIDLTERELEILRKVATGASNKQIAQALKISPNTVKVHLRNIFEKIGVLSRTEAALYALRTGLVAAESPPVEIGSGNAQAIISEGQTNVAPRKRPRLAIMLAPVGVLLVISAILIWQWLAGSSEQVAVQPDLPARWQVETRLPAPRSAMAAVVYEGQLYLIGGLSSQGITASVLRLDEANSAGPDSPGWEERTSMPAALGYIQAALLGEKVYVPGGCDAAGLPTRQVHIYDPRLDRWELGPPLPQAECGYALAVADGHLYLFGGWDGKAPLVNTWIYDPLEKSWSKGSPMANPVSYASAQSLEGRIFVTGGYDGAHALADNRVYYPSRDQAGEPAWEAKTPLPGGRYGMSSAGLAGAIYLAGGVGDQDSPAAAPLEYLPRTDQWIAFETPPEAAGAFPALLAVDTRLHLLGGNSTGGPGANHQSYQAIYTILFPVVH